MSEPEDQLANLTAIVAVQEALISDLYLERILSQENPLAELVRVENSISALLTEIERPYVARNFEALFAGWREILRTKELADHGAAAPLRPDQ